MSTYERAAALAPRDVSAELAAADRRGKSDLARAQAAREAGRGAEADTAGILAGMTAEKLAGLRVADAARREWAEAHAGEAAKARAAEAELRRRDQAERVAQAAETSKEFRARLPQILAGAEARYAAEAGKAEPEAAPAAEPEAEPGPEADQAEIYAEIHEDLAAIGEGIRELSAWMDAEDARRAEAQQEAMNEPAAWQQPESQAQAETTPESSWEPGEAMDFEAEI